MPKYKLPVRAAKTIKHEETYVILKAVNQAGTMLIQQFFKKKQEWEERNQKEFYPMVTIDLRYQDRTAKQNNSVWALVEAIWSSMEKDPPTEEEKYALYLDLLEIYADKVKNKITGELRPVHISEADSMAGARFISGLICHLATCCELDSYAQSSVIDALQAWHEWRGRQEVDPVDYSDLECTRLLTEAEWRERRLCSEASGQCGQIVLAHIVSRGSDAADIHKSWNWVALLHQEHMQQHQIGWDAFLQIYPHLRGRVNRARNLAGKLELEFKRERQAIEYKPENLAAQALEE